MTTIASSPTLHPCVTIKLIQNSILYHRELQHSPPTIYVSAAQSKLNNITHISHRHSIFPIIRSLRVFRFQWFNLPQEIRDILILFMAENVKLTVSYVIHAVCIAPWLFIYSL